MGCYKSVAYQAVITTLPKGVAVVLYIVFKFGTLYSQEYSHGYQNTDPKVKVRCMVAYHYILVRLWYIEIYGI